MSTALDGASTGTIGYVQPATTGVIPLTWTTKHQHHECHHQIQYCNGCDAAYCTKCGKEWSNKNWTYYQPYVVWNDTNDVTVTQTISSAPHIHY